MVSVPRQDWLLPEPLPPGDPRGRENFFLPPFFAAKVGNGGAVSLALAPHPRHLAVPPGV